MGNHHCFWRLKDYFTAPFGVLAEQNSPVFLDERVSHDKPRIAKCTNWERQALTGPNSASQLATSEILSRDLVTPLGGPPITPSAPVDSSARVAAKGVISDDGIFLSEHDLICILHN